VVTPKFFRNPPQKAELHSIARLLKLFDFLPAVTLAKAHACATTVFVDEFDTAFFQSRAYFLSRSSAARELPLGRFKPRNSWF
jgi:hypothetical protein